MAQVILDPFQLGSSLNLEPMVKQHAQDVSSSQVQKEIVPWIPAGATKLDR